jgi:hypothetical protein
MQIARRGQSLPKGSVVRHSKIGRQVKRWVNRFTSTGWGRPRNVRFTPNSDRIDASRQNDAKCQLET